MAARQDRISVFICIMLINAYFAGGAGAGAGGLMMVVLFSTFLVSFAGGLTIVVLFSTFFSSFAGGLMIVVFFSVVGAGAVVRRSHAVKRNTEPRVMMIGFMILLFLVRWLSLGASLF